MNGSGAPKGTSPGSAAATWIARLHADDRSRDDETAFRHWLAEDSDHAAQFERATAIWNLTSGTTASRDPVPSRRAAMIGVGAVLVALLGAGGVTFEAAQARARFATGIGERRRISLGDGSRLLLDAETSIRVAPRRLWLREGRVGLTVTRAAAPFVIEAGDSVLRSEAGRFDVHRRADDRLAITDVDGHAMVSIEGAAHALTPGDRLRGGIDRPFARDRPDLAEALAWEVGRAAFRDDMLADVANEANRYSPVRIVVADPATAARRVSGIYRVGDNIALGRSLATLLNIRVRISSDAVLLGG